MTTRIDGPGIAGTATVQFYTDGWWTITPDANHPEKPDSSPTPETGEATDEPTYKELAAAFYKNPGNWHTGMLEVYRLGVAHGEAKICKRLPRLWGEWHRGSWFGPFFAFEDEAKRNTPRDHSVREYDYLTGRPKG